MPIGTKDDMVVYEAQFQTGLTEVVAQNVDVFNAAGGGAIILENDLQPGDFLQNAMYLLSGGFAKRDPSSTATVDPTPLTQDESVAPKINWRDGPYESTSDSFRKIGSTDDEMALILGQQAGGKISQAMVESAAAALKGLIYDATSPFSEGRFDNGNAAITHKHLFKGLGKFGDRGQSGIVAWLMDGVTYYELAQSATDVEVTNVAGTTINSGSPPTLGLPSIVTDSAFLRVDATSQGADRSLIYGLAPGAVRLKVSEITKFLLDEIGGRENIVMQYQSEGAYTIEAKGAAFAKATPNPSDADLAVPANWTQVVTSHKDGPGIVVIAAGSWN